MRRAHDLNSDAAVCSAAGARNTAEQHRVVALIGNPNTGKTTLFNALTGFKRLAANYPGVTVDLARGPIRGGSMSMELLDLPGTYSLAAVSPDEMVVTTVTCGRVEGQRAPDVLLAILDATNLHRNMYLVSQLLDLGLPLVVAVNQIDVARARGIEINCDLLAERLGVTVLPVVATRPQTTQALIPAIEAAFDCPLPRERVEFPPEFEAAVTQVMRSGPGATERAEAMRVLADCCGHCQAAFVSRGGSHETLVAARESLREAGVDAFKLEVRERYRWIHEILDGVIVRRTPDRVTRTERIDRILTHKVYGGIVLLVVLGIVFQSMFSWAGPLMDGIEAAFGIVAEAVGALLPAGPIRSMVADGVIGGVGGVIVFLPQIVILFACIAILEDCGYMARAAYMNDRLMRAMGLSGRSFIPLLSCFACAVPAIMGTRSIPDRRERMIAMLLTPLLSCSARLPVYVLMISAFVPNVGYLGGWLRLQALVLLAMYLVGVAVAIPFAFLLRKTVYAGASGGFVLELPPYRVPRLRALWQRVFFAGREFLVRAGTIILIVNLAVWALGYFPHSNAVRATVEEQAAAQGWSAEQTETELAGAYLRDSYLARMGHAIEPVVKPLGWDWRIGVGVIASFPAREVVVATMGTIFNLEEDEDEGFTALEDELSAARWPDSGQPVFTLPVALSIMVFFALCAQCSATLVTLGREAKSWAWPVVMFVSMTILAYFAAWGTAAVARALGG